MNKVILIGHISTDLELKYSQSNIPFTRFNLAVNRPKQVDKPQEVDFISVVAWRKQAENLCQYQTKGNQIAVEGKIQVSNYQDKDGNKRYSTDVIADNIQFLDSKKESGQAVTPQEIEEHTVKMSDFAKKDSDPFADFGEQLDTVLDDGFLD